MRASRSGTIVNISSTSGLRALPTVSMYAASKHALEAVTEALSIEVESFGIRVLLVEPGAFRTNFLGQGAVTFNPVNEAYRGTVVEQITRTMEAQDGKQAGDPDKAAEKIYEVVEGEGMASGKKKYLRLVLGAQAYDTAVARAEQLKENFQAFEDISKSVDYES